MIGPDFGGVSVLYLAQLVSSKGIAKSGNHTHEKYLDNRL
ncbi:MAG: hypothetical protein ACI8UO_003311 [Verrucomicrobiales bacterium]|jgi:hypothetical protein